ncbi:condensation domain-containing protein [Streptomyces sp. NPDC059740]|uniref:condensation domain-containing protein n=1 Tax=Streptomyces sp. NPDC059740 TaxID=3346926 RepID=UPI00364D791E
MIVARYPLSHGQRGLWFVQELRGATSAYHDREVFHLVGPLDLTALTEAVTELTDRHEMLRTRFVTIGGEPVQVVDDRWRGEVRVQRAAAGADRDDQVAAFVAAVTAQPLDLANGPLFRVDVLALDERDHVLVFTLHHIITDGWSVRLMLEELSRSYARLTAAGARAPGPAPRPRQYGEFALWQRDTLTGSERDRLLAYWADHIAGAPTELDLGPGRPGDGAGPAAVTIGFDIPATTVQPLDAFARSCGATPFMALLAVFETVLAQAARTRDLLVGVPVVGRTVPGFEDSLGFFVNLLALRADLRDDPTGEQLLRAVRRNVLGGFAHQDLPFEQLVVGVNPARTPEAHPLVQATLQLIDGSFDSALQLDGTSAVGLPVDEPEIAYALTLDLHGRDGGLHGRLTYTPAAVDPQLARAIAEGVARLAALLPAHPQCRVSELQALVAREVPGLPPPERAAPPSVPSPTATSEE